MLGLRFAIVALFLVSGCDPAAQESTEGTTPEAAGDESESESAAEADTSETEAPADEDEADDEADQSAAIGGAPWVEGLSGGCESDGDCVVVHACVHYAIRADARETFRERIRGVRFRCQRGEGARDVEARARCVANRCVLAED